MNGNNARTFTPIYDDFPEELNLYAIAAYAAIYRFCTMRNGECTASNETLAKAAHMSVRTFIRNKHWLEKHGYITDIAGSYATSTHVLKITENPIDTQNNPAQCHSDTMSQCHSDAVTLCQKDTAASDTDVQAYDTDVQAYDTDVKTSDTVSYKDTIGYLKDTNKIPPQDTGNVDEEMSQSGIDVNISKEKDPAAEAALKKIFKSYEDEIGNITPTISEKIQIYLDDDVNPQWIIDAIEISSENNARRWSYTEGILKRWIAQGNKNDYRQKVDNSQFPSERGWSTV